MILNFGVTADMYVKDYVTSVAGWELHETGHFKFCYLGDVSAIAFNAGGFQ